MEADAARVNYLNSRLRNALFKSKPGFEVEKIQSPVTGLNGGYVARIGVGQPATESSLIVDTGSEIVWLKCSPCKNCSNPVFDPSKSSTYQNLSCTAPQCSENTIGLSCAPTSDGDGDGTCSFEASYGDGSITTGDFVTETLSFGSSGFAKDIAIGCGHEVGGNLQSFGGLLGLGPDLISLPNQLKATSFFYFLVGSSLTSTFGTLDFNSDAPGDSITLAIVHNPIIDIFFYVELTGIIVGKDQIPVPPEVYQISSTDGTGGVIVDSGLTLTYLDSQVYNSFLEAFKKNAQNLVSSPTQEGSDACYSFPSGSSLQGPTMAFQFSNGLSLALAPENYFIEGDNSAYCLTFQPTNQIVSIIGNIAQKRMRVTYDSGLTLTYLDSQVYNSFLEAFKKNAQNLVSSPTQEGSDACYSFPSGSSLQGPTMAFQFSNGLSLALAPENYFIEGDNSAYCLTFQPTNQIVSIIGNIAQKRMRVTYDLGNNQISFSINKC